MGRSNSNSNTEELEIVQADNLNAFDPNTFNTGFQTDALLQLTEAQNQREHEYRMEQLRLRSKYDNKQSKRDHEARQIFNENMYELITSVTTIIIVTASSGTVVYILNKSVDELTSITGKVIGKLGGVGFGTVAASVGKAYTSLVNTPIVFCELKNKVKWTPDKCGEQIDSTSFTNTIDDYTKSFINTISDTAGDIGDSSSALLANVLIFMIALFMISLLWGFIRFATQTTKLSIFGVNMEIKKKGTNRNRRAINNRRNRRTNTGRANINRTRSRSRPAIGPGPAQ